MTDAGVRLAAELLSRERALARRDASLVSEPLAKLLDDAFVEIGASGRIWDRDTVARELETSARREVELADFRLTLLGAGLALVTYRSVERGDRGERVVLRSSIWRLDGDRWRIRFQQGTLLGSAGDPPAGAQPGDPSEDGAR